MTDTQAKNHYTVKWITVTALFMALNVVMSSFGLPVPGGHLYLTKAFKFSPSIYLLPPSVTKNYHRYRKLSKQRKLT